MATKIGPSTVSYGIGVQNRYSAFLEDEDSFALSNIMKRPTNDNPVVNKQKSTVGMAKSSSTKTAQRSDSSSVNQNKKQDGQQKSPPSQTNGQQIKGDARRQQRDAKPSQHHQANGNSKQSARNNANRNKSHNQDGAVTTNGSQRFSRHQYNGTHQQQPSDNATQQHSKENQQGNPSGRPMRPNTLRFNPRPRMQNDDKKSGPQQQHDGPLANGHLASNDEEKARRQQRRLNNLRFKDPEKRERRNQATTNDGGADQQAKVNEPNDEKSTDQRGQRNRRDFAKNRARPRRNNSGGEPNGDTVKRENRRERPNRQRNEFGGSHLDAGNKQEKPKPIPNFSDKADFPSLAS